MEPSSTRPGGKERCSIPPANPITALVREWVIKAENDLAAAGHILKLGRDCPTDTVCFHAQQCVEKYLKALLVMRQIGFTKTHDLRTLMQLLPSAPAIQLDVSEQDRLTKFAVTARYPGSYDLPLSEARRAVRIARRVRREVRRLLPRGALRRPH